jgi:hypothetical protein
MKIGDLVRYHNAYLEETRYGIIVDIGTLGMVYIVVNFGNGNESFLDTTEFEVIG